MRNTKLSKCVKCNKIREVRVDSRAKFCLPCGKSAPKPNRIINLTNKKIGRLLVLSPAFNIKKYEWLCLCDCGNKVYVAGSRLRNKKTKSCGCIVKVKNGESTSSTYRSWKAMISRCTDPKNNRYKNYGGKGITVCDRWINSYESFKQDMGMRPANKTLDRIDVTKNYSPINTRWATIKQQSNNRSTNFKITYNNKTQTLTQWAEELGIKWSTLRKRIIILKWPLEKALQKAKKK